MGSFSLKGERDELPRTVRSQTLGSALYAACVCLSACGASSTTTTTDVNHVSDGDKDAGGGGDNDAGVAGPSFPAPSKFACKQLDPARAEVKERKCFDFADGKADAFMPEGGKWSVEDDAYVGTGPAKALHCANTGSSIVTSMLSNVTASNVRVHAQLTGYDRADKVIVLRARDPGNRIEVNVRSSWEDGGKTYKGDLIIQETIDCKSKAYTAAGAISIPHAMTDAVAVDIELIGQMFTVSVDNEQVFHSLVPVSTDAGAVGFGVILGATTRFDDIVVEALN